MEVKLLTTDYRGSDASGAQDCEIRTFHCLTDSWQWSPALGKAIDAEIRWADIVNVHTMWTYPVAVAARACASAGVPYILRPAGMLDQWSLSQKSFKKKIYVSLIERRTINRAAALWFTSEEERTGARPFDYKTRDFVIPLGIALSEYLELPAKGIFRNRFLNSSEKRIVLFIGRLDPKKRPDLLLETFADLADDFEDTILVIAGPDERGTLHSLKKLASALGIQNRVYFTSDLQKQDVTAALNDAEVFVLPSLHENFGVAVIEAMASGTPVIVSKSVGLASVVKDSGAGIVIEPTRGALGSSLRYILSNPTVAAKMGTHGRQKALESFSWDHIIPSLVDVYAKTISANANG